MLFDIIGTILIIGFIWFCYEILIAPDFSDYCDDDTEF